jgi:RNA polymerase sigma-70 factor (ECF subfamily)
MSHLNAGIASEFPTTLWTLVLEAGDGDDHVAHAALGELLQRYMPAMRGYLMRRWRMREEDANDILQGFISDKVLEKKLVSKADRARGKFRSLLLTALKRYVIEQRRKAKAAKRDGGPQLPLDEAMDSPAERDGQDEAFDIEWAQALVRQAVARMEKECSASGRLDVWAIFDRRMLGPLWRSEPMPGYDELVRELGLQSPTQASNLFITAKRQYERCLRAVIREYVVDDREVDAEIASLRSVLASAGAG